MQSLAALAICILIGASILVGVRLLVLHRRTGGWPELMLGGMLLLATGFGYPLRIAANQASPESVGMLVIASDICIGIGFCLLFVFTWRVFRPQAAWARALTAASVITLLGRALHGAIEIHSRGVTQLTEEPLGTLLLQAGPVFVASLWTGLESLRYHGMMRRRVDLGLADVAVSNRFLLWGLMGLCQAAGVVVNVWATALNVNVFDDAWILLLSSTSGLSQAVFLVLAFLPPRSYLDWVRGRAAVSGD